MGLIGGFDFLGTRYASNPFDIVLANDINERATMTLGYNFDNLNIVCGDAIELVKSDLPYADVLVGGFPCQDFSLAGKKQGLAVERGNLYKAMVCALKKVRPKIFIAENVKGLLLWQNGLAIKTIIEDFAECGYEVTYKLLNMADFGIPQKRERIFIVGVRKDLQKEFKFPSPTHAEIPTETLKKWVSIEDAIKDLEDDAVASQKFNNDYSKAKKNKGQGNSVTKANQPAPTMRAEHHGNIEFHYRLPRRLSAREAARIQSFPDNFKFLNSTTDAYRQIGNAVAPVFAWHLAQSILEILKSEGDLK